MMRLIFVFCFVGSSLAIAAPLGSDEEPMVPVTDRLADTDELARPVSFVVGPSAEPSPSPTTTPVRRAVPRVKLVADKPTLPPILTPKPTPTPTPEPTPTPPPTPEPTPEPTSARTYTREEVKAGIRSAWGGDDDEAIEVADCESGLNPRASSGSGHFGLWQMRMETWRTYGGSGDPRDHSPAEQTKVAYRLFQQRGWSPWAGCSP